MREIIRKQREKLGSNAQSGFTLMELIIVVAILGFLIAILLPRYTNYTDKAMGVAAAADAKNVLTASVADMLDKDNAGFISETELRTQTGIGGAGGSGKTVTVNTGNRSITYTYEKGGVSVVATITPDNGQIAWAVTAPGGDTGDRANAVKSGLGIGASTPAPPSGG